MSAVNCIASWPNAILDAHHEAHLLAGLAVARIWNRDSRWFADLRGAGG